MISPPSSAKAVWARLFFGVCNISHPPAAAFIDGRMFFMRFFVDCRHIVALVQHNNAPLVCF